MNLKCDFPTPLETTADVPTTSYNEECIFEDFGNSAIFDTGSPYRNDMRQGFSGPIHLLDHNCHDKSLSIIIIVKNLYNVL